MATTQAKKKKILLINDFKTHGGAETVLALHAQILKDEFELDCFYGDEQVPKRTFLSYIYSAAAKKALKDQLDKNNYDIIHIYNYHHILSPAIYQAIREVKLEGKKPKVIYSAHDFHLVCPNSGFYFYKGDKLVNFQIKPSYSDLILNRIDKRSFAHDILKKLQWTYAYKIKRYQDDIDHIISPGNFLRKVLIKNIAKPVTLIRNPVELNETNDSVEKPLNNDVIRMIFMGRIHLEKGLYELINTLSNVTEIPYTLTIYGDGPQRDVIETLINAKGLTDKVFLKGSKKREELLAELKNYNVFVLPSLWYENAPMSIVEAAAAGLAIFTSNHGGMVEIAEECGGGFYFEPGNTKSLLDCLQAYRNSEKNNNINNTREQLRENFSMEKFKSQLITFYNTI